MSWTTSITFQLHGLKYDDISGNNKDFTKGNGIDTLGYNPDNYAFTYAGRVAIWRTAIVQLRMLIECGFEIYNYNLFTDVFKTPDITNCFGLYESIPKEYFL